MSTPLDLLFVPFHDWRKCEREGFRTRDAHLMQQIGRHPNVGRMLVVNRPISLSEIAIYRHGWRVRRGRLLRRRGGAYLSQVGPKTYTLDIVVPEVLRPLAMRRAWTRYIFARPHVAAAVRAAMRDMGLSDDYAMFLSAPLFTPLARALRPPILIADAQDNLLKHALYRDVPGLAEEYDYWMQHADLLYANSPETAGWFAERRPDALCIPNGVDLEVFDPTIPRPRPADMAGIPGPIIGYAGKMQEMIDVEALVATLRALPDVHMVFIGQQLNPAWMARVWSEPNAHYLGDKPYDQLPGYLSAFDICLIPYHTARQHGVDPIKLYEYLAMGKLVVSTQIGKAQDFAAYPQVRVAKNPAEFTAAVGEFVSRLRAGEQIVRWPVPEQSTWAYKADTIMAAAIRQLPQGRAI
ncbi:glycosyltransferase [Oscillochloris sp. ZM17-4]|uniref:glycosyltransferase n=1 Tax=Oscillochloris sp. ZM17-4 TaxID=2866714 RepID=UPI001C737E81|nr:glycosyltransferase [Oscillochloris sp. ZM17-4]MBX0330764.1 glycosyltransferase [Oscillochloris sp. ZM17-4]